MPLQVFPNYEMEHQANRKVLIEDLYKAYQLFSAAGACSMTKSTPARAETDVAVH